MARYFFDIDDGRSATSDDIGLDLPDASDVAKQAVAVLPGIAKEELPDGFDRRFSVSVRNQAGRRVFQASLTLKAAWL